MRRRCSACSSKISTSPLTAAAQNGLCASAALDERAGDIIVKVVNTAATARPLRVVLDGVTATGAGRMQILSNADLQAENSLDQPARVAPVESVVTLNGTQLRLDLPPQSVTVVRVLRGR